MASRCGGLPGARSSRPLADRQARAPDLLSADCLRRRARADDPVLRALSTWPCEPSILSLFHLGRDWIVDPAAHLLSQDAIYVGGGSMRNLLVVWHEHGVDEAMGQAWERGVVLAGLSAGAMCWFEAG